MGFEIKKVAVADTSVLHLKDGEGNLLWDEANGEKKPVEVELYGPGSREHAQANARRSARLMQRARKRGKAALSADETTEEGAIFLTDITAGFRNFDYDGQAVTTREQIKAVYVDRTIGFIGDQVNEHIGDWENFTKSSATS